MKSDLETKARTAGEFIMAVFDAGSKRRAGGLAAPIGNSHPFESRRNDHLAILEPDTDNIFHSDEHNS